MAERLTLFPFARTQFDKAITSRPIRLVARRLALAIPTVLGVLVLNFFLIRLIPGDTVDALVTEAQGADDAFKDQLRHELGLDQSIWIQLTIYAWRVAHLDLGWSYRYSAPVLDVVVSRLGPTVLLMASSILLALVVGVFLGATAARHFRNWKDGAVTVAVLLLYATPTFWVGLMLTVAFAIKLRLFPVDGYATIGQGKAGWWYALDVAHHLVLPAVTLSLFYLAVYARLMRTSMLELVGSDFVRTARAKGLSESAVLWRHMLRNALLPVITLIGIQVSSLFGGAIVVETVFSWPGLGRLAYDAVLQRDYNLLLAILLMSVMVVVVVNVIIDLVYAWIDPRVDAA